MKAMKWSKNHTDIYAFDGTKWVKIECRLRESGMHCTAAATLPKGTKFSYNVKPNQGLERKAALAMSQI